MANGEKILRDPGAFPLRSRSKRLINEQKGPGGQPINDSVQSCQLFIQFAASRIRVFFSGKVGKNAIAQVRAKGCRGHEQTALHQ